MVRTIAAAGLHHRRGPSSNRVLRTGLEADATSGSSRGEVGEGVGPRLLSCLDLHPQNGRCLVPRFAPGAGLGEEDVPVAEVEATRDLPDLALGGGAAAPSDGAGSGAQSLPAGV